MVKSYPRIKLPWVSGNQTWAGPPEGNFHIMWLVPGELWCYHDDFGRCHSANTPILIGAAVAKAREEVQRNDSVVGDG